jgi:hypothetical protein
MGSSRPMVTIRASGTRFRATRRARGGPRRRAFGHFPNLRRCSRPPALRCTTWPSQKTIPIRHGCQPGRRGRNSARARPAPQGWSARPGTDKLSPADETRCRAPGSSRVPVPSRIQRVPRERGRQPGHQLVRRGAWADSGVLRGKIASLRRSKAKIGLGTPQEGALSYVTPRPSTPRPTECPLWLS